MSGEIVSTSYVIVNRGVGRELLAKETKLVQNVLQLWPEYADFINLVNGAEVDDREPTLTIDSLYLSLYFAKKRAHFCGKRVVRSCDYLLTCTVPVS